MPEATEPVRRVLNALATAGRKTRTGASGWEAQCPAHDDGRESLSITVGRDGRALLNCHANCETNQVLAALGLQMRDLFAANSNGHTNGIHQPRPRALPAPKAAARRDRGELVATYDYVDEQGHLLQQALRYRGADGKKSFSQRRPDPERPGAWIYKLGDVRQVVYRLPLVLEAIAAGETIWIVEGEKDVHSLEQLGLVATCNAMGAGKWKPSHTEAIAGAVRVVIVADKDKPGREHAAHVAGELDGWVGEIRVIEVPVDGAKDATDWIERGAGRADFEQLAAAAPAWTRAPAQPELESRQDLEEPAHLRDAPPPEEPPAGGGGDGGEPPEPPLIHLRSKSYLSIVRILSTPEFRSRVLGDRKIELNEMGEQITIGRRPVMPVDISRIRAAVEEKFVTRNGTGLKFAKQDVEEAVRQVAEDARYHPVQEYLRSLEWDGVPRLEHVADELLDISNPAPIVHSMLRKWFIGAVARAMRPGCKVKAMLILIGAQNAAKSTFFEILASRDWFSDTAIDIHNKEAHVVLSSVWIQEWAELREMQGRTAEAVKNFISSPEGKFLPKYANIMVSKKRTSVIVGTTNEQRFLDDATGNVRYWPVVVGPEINLEGARNQRDQLWAEARAAFDAGELWWLSPAEERELADLQKDHEKVDPWEEQVLDFAESYIGHLTTNVILSDALHLEPKHKGSWEEQRVAKILRRNGWADTGRPRDGKRRLRAWLRTGHVTSANGSTDPGVDQGENATPGPH